MKQGVHRQEVGLDQLVGRWVLNSSENEVRFTEPVFWGLVKVKGRFTTFGGSGAIEPGGKVTGSVRIEAASLDTNNKKRDAHLRSSDFFDVERHPVITVDVSSVAIRGNAADIHAALAIRGVHEPITLTASVEDVTADSVHLKAQAKVDRGRFGMTWKKMGATGHATIKVDAVFRRSTE